MVGLAIVTMVSLPLLYSVQRKDELELNNEYSYYTGYSNYDHFYESKVLDLESSFIVEHDFEDNSYKANLLKSLNSWFDRENLSTDVYNNLYTILDELPEEIINMVDIDNIYVSDTGTVIVDIYNDGGVFSLEIGRTKVGYFADINDSFVYQNDGIEFSMYNTANLPFLIKDLLGFNDRIVAA
jgi:hypothetical protein